MNQQLQVLKRLCFSAMALSVAGLTVISAQTARAQDAPPATPSVELNTGSGSGSSLDAAPGSTMQPGTTQNTPAQPLRTQQRLNNLDRIRIDSDTTPASPLRQNGTGQQNDTLNQDTTIDQNNTPDQNGTMEQDRMMEQDGTIQRDTTLQQDTTIQQNGTTNTTPTSQPRMNQDMAPSTQPTEMENTAPATTTETDQSPAAWW